MPAAEAVLAMHGTVLEHADLDRAASEISKRMQELGSKLSAVSVVGNPKTVAATSKFAFRCATAMALLRAQRGRMKPLTGRNVELIKKLQREVSKWTQTDDKAIQDQRLNDLWAVADGESKKINEDIQAAFELVKSCLDWAKEIGDLVPPVIFALRAELGLTVNEVEYTKVWQESSARTYQFTERFLSECEGFLADLQRRKAEGSTEGPPGAA